MSSKRRKGRATPAELHPEPVPPEAVDAPGSQPAPVEAQPQAYEGLGEAGAGEAGAVEAQAVDEPDLHEAHPEGEGAPPLEAATGDPAGSAAPARRRRAQHPPPPPERLAGAVEALLLASGDALTPERIRDVLGLSSAIHVREALEQVRQRWVEAGLSVELQEVAGGVRVVTRPEYAEYVRRLARHVVDGRLSQGQLETLSIVAYRQPVARPEIERIRGVQVGEALRALLERNLVKVVGRSDQPGRPMLYGTTKKFLTTFGLNDIKDLPSAKDLARL